MKNDTDLTRRAALGLIGALGASAAHGGTNTTFKHDSDPHDLELPHTSSTVIDTVTAHAVSELSNDLGIILPTVSAWDQHYAVLVPNADGTLTLRSAFSSEEVLQYYTANHATTVNNGGERRLNEHAGRWYDLIDTLYNVTRLPNGPTLTGLRGVFLFPTWPDGIIGEIFWPAPSWIQTFAVEDPKEFTDKLIAYEDAWKSGDVDARLATMEEQTCSCVRVTNVTGTQRSRFIAKTKDELRTGWESPEAGTVLEFTRLHHIISTFYVFAAYKTVLKVGSEKVVRETAVLFPIGPNRKFVGELSYSFEAKF